MNVRNRTLDSDELISEISEMLTSADGDFIANIANQVLADKVTYTEDSIFKLEAE